MPALPFVPTRHNSPSSAANTHARRAGERAGNAAHLFMWTQTLGRLKFVGARFAVLGCEVRALRMGAHVPARAAHLRRAPLSACLLAPRGLDDVKGADFFEVFDECMA